MVDLEKLSATAMEIITYSGVAKSTYIQAMQFAKQHRFEEAQQKLDEGDSYLKQAHAQHMGLLQSEAEKNEPQVSMLVLHAEDQFMSCETIKIMVMDLMNYIRKKETKMAKQMYDLWSKITTRNGYAGDEVISSLQKSIRRGLEEQACMFAYEMYVSSPELEEKMWRRLLTISVEDIGMGDPMAAVMVNNLFEMRKNFAYSDGDRPMYFLHAIRYLCKCEKDRSSDLLKLFVLRVSQWENIQKFLIMHWINIHSVERKWGEILSIS